MSLCPFAESKWISAMPCKMEICNFLNSKHHVHFLLLSSSSSSSLAAKQDVFTYVFPRPGLEVAGGMSSRDQCAILSNKIVQALGPGFCLRSSISSPRVLVQLGDTLTHLAAASLCPALVSSKREWQV